MPSFLTAFSRRVDPRRLGPTGAAATSRSRGGAEPGRATRRAAPAGAPTVHGATRVHQPGKRQLTQKTPSFLTVFPEQVDPRRFELLTSSMRTRRATNCAKGPCCVATLSRARLPFHPRTPSRVCRKVRVAGAPTHKNAQTREGQTAGWCEIAIWERSKPQKCTNPRRVREVSRRRGGGARPR